MNARWTIAGRALRVEQRHQRLADAQLGDGPLGVERRVRAQGLRRRPHRLLVLRGERAQRVLDAVAELAQHASRGRRAGSGCRSRCRRPWSGSAAPPARPSRAAPSARRRRAGAPRRRRTPAWACRDRRPRAGSRRAPTGATGGTSSRAWATASAGRRRARSPRRGPSASVCIRSSMFSMGSPKNRSAPCCSSSSRRRWIAPIEAAETLPYWVLNCAASLADVLQHRPQILEVEEQQAAVVGDLEDEREHAGLRVVQVEEAPQEQRPHVRDRRAHRMTLLAVDVPEGDRTARPRAARRAPASRAAPSSSARGFPERRCPRGRPSRRP